MILFRNFLLLGLADDSSEAVNESEEIKIGKQQNKIFINQTFPTEKARKVI